MSIVILCATCLNLLIVKMHNEAQSRYTPLDALNAFLRIDETEEPKHKKKRVETRAGFLHFFLFNYLFIYSGLSV